MKNTLTLISLLFVMMLAAPASAMELKAVGKAEMRWLMFPLYQVTLKTADGKYQEGSYPQMLDIMYRRNVTKEDLITATDQQWQRLGVPAAQREKWLPELSKLWPSIKKGDRLALNVAANGSNYFSFNGKNIGGVNDPAFGQAFLSIWLSPNTSQPGIRRLLIAPNS